MNAFNFTVFIKLILYLINVEYDKNKGAYKMQQLRTIIATSDAIPILKALPTDLHPCIYQYIYDEVKVHYWMKKYDWADTIHTLGDYYGNNLSMIFAYFEYTTGGYMTKCEFLNEIGAYREKTKWRDANGRVIRIEWGWNDDNCDYESVYMAYLCDMIYEQYEMRRDMKGLYKYLAHLIVLWEQMEANHTDSDSE